MKLKYVIIIILLSMFMFSLFFSNNINELQSINSIHFEGNSITECAYFLQNDRYSSLFGSANPSINVVNTSKGSATIAGGTNSVQWRLDNEIPNAPDTNSYFSIMIGTNNVALGTNVSLYWTQLQAVWQTAINKGYKLIVWTLPDFSSDYGQDNRQARVDLNTLISNNYQSYNAILVDVRTIPQINIWDIGNGYWRDIVHPNEAGQILLFNKLEESLINE